MVYFPEPTVLPPLPAVDGDHPCALVQILQKVGSSRGTPVPLTCPQPGLGCPSPGQLGFVGGNAIKSVSLEGICCKESEAPQLQVYFRPARARRPWG